jgi:hypothetical protein
MNLFTIALILIVIFSIIYAVSFIAGIGFLIKTPGERLSFSDKKEKSKLLRYLKLRR